MAYTQSVYTVIAQNKDFSARSQTDLHEIRGLVSSAMQGSKLLNWGHHVRVRQRSHKEFFLYLKVAVTKFIKIHSRNCHQQL